MNLAREFDLEPGEIIQVQVRKHWFIFLAELVPYALLALLPFLLPTAIHLAGPALQSFAGFTGWGSPLGRIILGCWWLLLWSAAFNTFTRYYLNAWIITNQRIVEIEQRAFFHREVSSLLLNRIQDVTIETEGIIHSLLDIGNINVQTAGAIDRFTMLNVPNPPVLRDLILAAAAAHTAHNAP